MVVVVIIGILVAIAVPIYGNIQDRAAIDAHKANVRLLQGVASVWFAEEGPPDSDDTGLIGSGGNFNEDFGDYIDGDEPTVPERLSGEGGDTYEVRIDIDGTTTITPSMDNWD